MKIPPLLVGLLLGAFPAPGFGQDSPPRVDALGGVLPERAVARLGTLRFLPEGDSISQLSVSPDGTKLASVCAARVGNVTPGVQVWEIPSGREIGPEALRDRDANAVAWTPDSRFLVTCHPSEERSTVEIWNLETGARDRVLAEAADTVSWVGCSPDGRWIAVAWTTDPVAIHNATTGQRESQLEATAEWLEFSPDGSRLLLGAAEELSVFATRGWKRIAQAAAKAAFSNTPALSPDLRSVAVCHGEGMRLIDLETGERSDALPGTEDLAALDIAFSQDGTLVAAAGYDGTTYVWDVATRQLVQSFLSTGFAVEFTPDGRSLVLSRRRLELVDPHSGERHTDLPGHTGGVPAVLHDPRSNRLISGGRDRSIRVWTLDGREERVIQCEGNVTALAIDTHGKYVAAGGAAVSPATVVSWPSGEQRWQLAETKAAVIDLDFSPNGQEVATTGLNGEFGIWKSEDGTPVTRVTSSMAPAGLSHLGYDVHGSTIVRSIPLDGSLELRDPASGRLRQRIFVSDKRLLVHLPFDFTADGTGIVTVEMFQEVDAAKQWLVIIDLRTGERGFSTNSRQTMYTEIECSPDGRWIAAAGRAAEGEYHIDLYSATTGTLQSTMSGHRGWIRGLAFLPDGSRLVSASEDSTLLIWELSDSLTEAGE